MDIKKAFYLNEHLEINKQRIEHFNSLKLNIVNKTILETGCGGKGDHTINLLKYTSNVTINDARLNNIKMCLTNINKNLEFNTWDLNIDFNTNGKMYDIIYCYGTLYHLYNPSLCIKNLSNICNDFMIICTAGNENDEGIEYVKEDISQHSQAYVKCGCRPSRKWVLDEMSKYFNYIYFPKTQPLHYDFKTDYSKRLNNGSNYRFIIIGSKNKIDNDLLTQNMPIQYLN
jgi:hypothetical protein